MPRTAAQPQRKITPAERNALFASLTRQNLQKLPSETLTENGSVTFNIPKTKLTSKIYLLFNMTYQGIHASSTTFTANRYAPWNIVRNVRVSINNGFTPFNISGAGAYLYNLLRLTDAALFTNIDNGDATDDERGIALQTNDLAASTGDPNRSRFMMELPLTLNERDPIGMIMTQNEEVVVSVTIDIGTALAHILDSGSGMTTSTFVGTVTPLIESFTIPVLPEAIPDLSVIKLVNEQTFTLSANTEAIIKLPTGTTYRKIILDLATTASPPVGLTDLEVANWQIVLNQADIPYNISTRQLENLNEYAYGRPLPAGVFVFDFSNQGLPNFGGSRDYIDTERLTEFWLKFTPTVAGTARVVSESLARLRGLA